MRQHSEQLPEVLTGSFERELVVNVYNGPDRVLEGARFESWQLESDLGRKVCTSGSGTIVHRSVEGESLSPVGTQGVLSAFRARVEPVMIIRAGDFSESVPLGLFRVVANPHVKDYTTVVDGREVVTASEVGVSFESLDRDVERWGFRFPAQSPQGVSAWGEVRRFTDMPVEETVDDVTVPSLKVWEAKQGGRLDAVHELGRVLGGDLVVNSRGAWEVIPTVMGEPVAALHLGELGTVLDVADEITTDTVYNEVVGSFEDEAGNPIYAVAAVEHGPLSIHGDYGRNTRYYSSDLVSTQAQADGAVRAVLDQSIGSQTYEVQVQCHVNPLIEIGDVVTVQGWKRPLTGRVRKVSLSSGAYMNVTLSVARVL